MNSKCFFIILVISIAITNSMHAMGRTFLRFNHFKCKTIKELGLHEGSEAARNKDYESVGVFFGLFFSGAGVYWWTKKRWNAKEGK